MRHRSLLARCCSAIAALLLVLSTSVSIAASEDMRVEILLSEDSGAYREAAQAVEQAVVAEGVAAGRFRTTLASAHRATPGDGTLLHVAVGMRALDVALATEPRVPIVAILVPRETFLRRQQGSDAKRMTAVFIDQPITRQVALIALALPDRKAIGVIVGPDSQVQLAALQAVVANRGLSLVVAAVRSEREIFPSLEKIIADAEVLLALPDPIVFNAGTIQNILLASYRRQVPMVGFSPAYLRAGALITLQSSPAQIASAAVDAIRAALDGRPLPPPRYPRDFSVTVNRHVARSLGIAIGSDEELAARLHAAEGTR